MDDLDDALDDGLDGDDRAWSQRLCRRLAQTRALERAHLRTAELLRPPLIVPPLLADEAFPAGPRVWGRPLTDAQRARGRATRLANWRALPAAERSARMAATVAVRWARTTQEERTALARRLRATQAQGTRRWVT